MVLGTFIGLVLLVIGLFALGYYLVKIPSANAAATKQSNVYLYADGSQLARDGEVNRENVSLAQISKDAQHAALAAEDRDFYTESAIDPKAMIRAGWNTATGKGRQSGSTITQQYVKNYYLGQEQTATRKVKEFFISIKLDRQKSKSDILEGYLNTSYYGRNAYGIQAAAQAYYGVDAQDLTVGQGAYLAALLNAPSEYDVIAHPENKAAALARWNYVLDGMVKKQWLTPAARGKVTFPEPKQSVIATGMSGQRGYLVKAVNDYLAEHKIIDEDTLQTGGYRITTTLQRPKQDAFVKAVDDQVMSHLDKKARKVDRYVRAGGVSIDPATGKVVAMYGGIDYTKQYVNNATRRDYQVGSTFKPFVFTSAVQNDSRTEDGRTITPNTFYDGTDKRPVQGWNGGTYAPENEDNVSYGPITVRTATDKSVNAVYAQMAVDVGPSKVKDTAVDLGVPADTPDLTATPSIALGPSTASVLDMAQAYATLANHGRHGTYTLVDKITKEGAEDVHLPKQATRQAVPRQAADTTTSVLRSVVEGGTGTAAQAAGRRRGQDRHRGGGPGGLVRRLHPEPRHRRRRHGPGPRHRRPQVPVRRARPGPAQRRRIPGTDLGAVHEVRAQGHRPERLRPATPAGRRGTAAAPEHRTHRPVPRHRRPGRRRRDRRPGHPEPAARRQRRPDPGPDGRRHHRRRHHHGRIDHRHHHRRRHHDRRVDHRHHHRRRHHDRRGRHRRRHPGQRRRHRRRDDGHHHRGGTADRTHPEKAVAAGADRDGSVAGGDLQADHGHQQQTDEEDPGGGRRLTEHDHAEHRRTGRADPHPHAVRRTDGQ